jgi:hypothetical protein
MHMSGPGSPSTSNREYSAFVDAGSGHTGIICYSYEPSGNSTTLNGLRQIAKDSIKAANGGNLPLTEVMAKGTPESFAEFIDQLRAILDSYRESWQPTLLYVGATGGVREAVETGKVSSADVASFRAALEAAFCATIRTVKLVVLDGVQEALYETDAAQVIWGLHSATMFPLCHNHGDNSAVSIGLFSGGGQSVQLGRLGEAPLSFGFSTFFKEFEEKQGAHADAWLDDEVWGRFESGLLGKILLVAQQQQQGGGNYNPQYPHPGGNNNPQQQQQQQQDGSGGGRFTGAYVCTAMNHRAAMYVLYSVLVIPSFLS